jgi:predicted nucleic acid-binding protein
MRIVLDTNVIISAIRSARGASFMLLDLAGEHNGFFELVLTEALSSEYEDVIYRPEHRMNWTDDELYGLIQKPACPGALDGYELHL